MNSVIVIALACLWMTMRWSSCVGQPDTPITLHYEVMEESDAGTEVGDVYQDAGLADRYSADVINALSFRFLKNPPELPFSVDSHGVITTSEQLDRDTLCASEPRCQTQLDVIAMTSNPTSLVEIIRVTVDILDLNDNTPYFPEPTVTFQLLESASIGTGLTLPRAIDPDAGPLGVQDYILSTITGTRNDSPFHLQVTAGATGAADVKLVLQRPLDRESERLYNLRILAQDGGHPRRSGSVDVTVQVLDENDNDPVFDNATYHVDILENVPINTPVVRVRAHDPDSGHYGTIVYRFSQITAQQHGNMFGIRNATGELYTKGNIDRELKSLYTLYVQAGDLGPDSMPADATVTVTIVDVNDNAPDIGVSTLSATSSDRADIMEDSNPGTFVAHLIVSDSDEGRNAQFNCTINDSTFYLLLVPPPAGSDTDPGVIRPTGSAVDYVSGSREYRLVTRGVLDRETQPRYTLSITCRDRGMQPQVAVKQIQILVGDVNDNPPMFDNDIYATRLDENSHVGVLITRVNATDLDTGINGRIHYSLDDDADSLFRINEVTGEITSRAVFDHEKDQEIRFRVFATDGGAPPLRGSAVVVVHINDVNDRAPVFSNNGQYTFGVTENSPAGTEVGLVSAHDADGPDHNTVRYTLIPGHTQTSLTKFRIDEANGQGRIMTLTPLDREEIPMYTLYVEARDNGNPAVHSTTATVVVHVTDINDHAPEFNFPSKLNNTVHVSSQTPVGHSIAKLSAHDLDMGRNANITYTITNPKQPQRFVVDARSGFVSVHSDLSDIAYEKFMLDIRASDQGDPIESAATSLNIVVNKSIPFVYPSTPLLAGHNFTIVVSLGCLTAIIVIILIIAIALIRRQDNDKKGRNYNCRMQALKAFHSGANGASADGGDEESGGAGATGGPGDHHHHHHHRDDTSNGSINTASKAPPIGTATTTGTATTSVLKNKTNGSCVYDKPPAGTVTGEKPQKEVSFNLDHENNSLPSYSSMVPGSGGCLKNAYTPSAHIAALEASPAHRSGPSSGSHQNGQNTKPWTLTQKELEVHQLLDMLRQDQQDADSAYSGESSNTDSGRGLSEEGEGLNGGNHGNHHHSNPHHHPHQHNHHQQQPHHHQNQQPHHHHTLQHPHHHRNGDISSLPTPPPPHSLSDSNLAAPSAGRHPGAGGAANQPGASSSGGPGGGGAASPSSPYHSYSNQPTPSFHTFSPTHSNSSGGGGVHAPHGGPTRGGGGGSHASSPGDSPASVGLSHRAISSLPTPPPPCTRGGGYYGGGSGSSSGAGGGAANAGGTRGRVGARHPQVPASIPEDSVININGHHPHPHPHPHPHYSPTPGVGVSPSNAPGSVGSSPYGTAKIRLKGNPSKDVTV